LKRFCTHELPTVRAAAITGLCSVDIPDGIPDLGIALKDEDTVVRKAAAEAIMTLIDRGFDKFSEPWKSRPKGGAGPEILEFRKGKFQPKVVPELVPLLEAMVEADDLTERVSAALPLVAVGRTQKAVPILLEAAQEDPELIPRISNAMPWLLWEERLEFFNKLTANVVNWKEFRGSILNFAEDSDPRAADVLWSLTSEDNANAEMAWSVLYGLRQIYLRKFYYRPSGASASAKKRVLTAAKEKVKAGPEWQRVVALALLPSVSPDDALEAATAIFNDPQSSVELRTDSFQIQLLSQSRTEARKLALAGFSHQEQSIRKIALEFLVNGAEKIDSLRDELSLNVDRGTYRSGSRDAVLS
ncbi:MAG: HEAT repeat domain-containing protein, partial [Planctomycetota bacterium]|nr:HEAT repeat domain-containing protein [Planctomycetota bacterium]